MVEKKRKFITAETLMKLWKGKAITDKDVKHIAKERGFKVDSAKKEVKNK